MSIVDRGAEVDRAGVVDGRCRCRRTRSTVSATAAATDVVVADVADDRQRLAAGLARSPRPRCRSCPAASGGARRSWRAGRRWRRRRAARTAIARPMPRLPPEMIIVLPGELAHGRAAYSHPARAPPPHLPLIHARCSCHHSASRDGRGRIDERRHDERHSIKLRTASGSPPAWPRPTLALAACGEKRDDGRIGAARAARSGRARRRISNRYLPITKFDRCVLTGRTGTSACGWSASCRRGPSAFPSAGETWRRRWSRTSVTDLRSGQLIEKTIDYFAQDRAGTVYYFGEDVNEYENGKLVGHSGQWRVGRDGPAARRADAGAPEGR